MNENHTDRHKKTFDVEVRKHPFLTRSLFPSRISTIKILAILSVWFVISYLSVSHLIHRRVTTELERHSAELKQTAIAVTYHFARSLFYLDILPARIADNLVVRASLRSYSGRSGRQESSVEDNHRFLVSRPELETLNRFLDVERREFDVDVLWVIDPDGTCIASSNFDKPESFVGINYADRAYFKSAMEGRRGKQYAVGRATNIPGFYFSAPVKAGDRIMAVVVAKIDVSRLNQWFSLFNCFVTDKAGVIVITSEKNLENHALAGSQVFQMIPETREKQYKRRDFPVLSIGNYGGLLNPYLSTTFPGSDVPYLLVRSDQDKNGYTIYSYAKLNEIEKLHGLILQITVLVFITGAALILFTAAVIRYMHDMRHSIGVAEDARRELQSLNETLEDRIKEEVRRSREKDNILLQQDKMASIGRLAAGVAHEINNPIGFINSNLVSLGKYVDKLKQYICQLESILKKPCDEQLPKEAATARATLKIDYVTKDIGALIDESNEGVERVRKIIQDLKTFSHKEEAEKTLTDLNGCIESSVNIVWNEIKYVANLKKELSAIPEIVCNPQQIGQVLINLLVNAAQAIKDHGEIIVRSWSDIDSAYVSISDTGSGISKENLQHIFDVFFTTKEVGKGTGLGLAISLEIVKKHGGELTVESEIGKGTTFTLRLPLVLSSQEKISCCG